MCNYATQYTIGIIAGLRSSFTALRFFLFKLYKEIGERMELSCVINVIFSQPKPKLCMSANQYL